MIYNCNSKTFKKFLRPLTKDEIVQAASMHACKHWHPKLSREKAAKFFAKEATRRAKVEKEQWSNWEEDKPQLYMDTYDLHHKRTLANMMILGQPVTKSNDESDLEYEPDPNVDVGDSWQPSIEDKNGASSSTSSYPWPPKPTSSTPQAVGASTGNPFLGGAAEELEEGQP